MKRLVIIFLTFSLMIALFVSIFLLSNKNKAKEKSSLPSPSENILFLTSPINTISGRVEGVFPDKIIINQSFIYQPSSLMPEMAMESSLTSPTPLPPPIVKTITFEILIDHKTKFQRENFSIPFLVSPQPTPRLTAADIKKGDFLTITTKQDLRTVKDNKITAVLITLPSITHQVVGKITKINQDSLELETEPPIIIESPSPSTKKLTFKITSKTEISYLKPVKELTVIDPNLPPSLMEIQKPVKLSIDDLKVDQKVNVYCFEDILKSPSPTAVRIEPIINFPPSPQ